jgi:hypothetical protein
MHLFRMLAIANFSILFVAVPAAAEAGKQAGSTAALPRLSGRFETDVIKFARRPIRGAYRWRFWRDEDTIETNREDTNVGERWTKTPSGKIKHVKIFHADKHAIDYETGDLKALNAYPDWQRQMTMVAPELLEELQKVEDTTFLDRPAVKYQGQVRGVDVEIVWLANEKLPAFIRRVYPDRTVSMKLLELHALQDAPSQPADSRGYHHIDYADVGDMEADPFVRKFVHGMGQHGGHAH